jgi:hypothetical protein
MSYGGGSRSPFRPGAGILRPRRVPWELLPGAEYNSFLPFAWDARAQRLYLDLNWNGDLTDDPAWALIGAGRDVQFHRGLWVEFPSHRGAYQVLADAHVFGQGAAPRVFLYVRSLWEGEAELGGKK